MTASDLLERVRRRDFTVGVVGLGRVGLPLAISFARRGVNVVGIDRDEGLLAAVEGGRMPFHEEQGNERLGEVLAAGTLRVTADPDALQQADAIFITVATGLNNELHIDYSQINAVLETLCPRLRSGQLLILRSTVSPGTMEKVVRPYVEAHSSLEVGRDLLLAAAPERIAAGRALIELETLPEIVGGLDEASTAVAAEVMRVLNPGKVVHTTDPMSAELAKLFTNVYRYVTFAIANEFAMLAEHYGRDAHAIINMINTGYPRGGLPLPGPCGGPCLAKDGYLLVEEINYTDFILTAWKLNESIPSYMVNRLKHALAANGQELTGAKVAVLGLAFKANIDDLRQSPAVRIVELLQREGADVHAHDPYHDTPALDEALAGADAVVLATNHSAYSGLRPEGMRSTTKSGCIFVDCWGAWDAPDADDRVLVFGRGQE